MRNLKIIKWLWGVTAILAIVAAINGIVVPNLYSKVLPSTLVPATWAQDWLTIVVAVGLTGLIVSIKENDFKKQIVALGIIGSFGYLYAIFSIERIYTWLYLVYLAILGLTLYGVPYSVAHFKMEEKFKTNKTIKSISIMFSLLIAILFSVLWVGALLPAMTTGQKIETYYSIFILDLVWIMPGFLITAWLYAKNKTAGILLTPAMYILGIFVIFPLGLGEAVKPLFGQIIDVKPMVMSFVLSGAFLFLAAANLLSLKKENN